MGADLALSDYFMDQMPRKCLNVPDEAQPNILEHVLKYLAHHKGNKPDPLPSPVRSIHMAQMVSDPWDAKWIDAFEKKTIFEIIMAGNDLGIKSLVNLGCAKIATCIKQL